MLYFFLRDRNKSRFLIIADVLLILLITASLFLLDQVTYLTDDLSSANEEINEQNNEIADLTNELEALSSDLHQAKIENDELNKGLDQSIQDLQAASEEKRQLSGSVAYLKDKTKTLESQVKTLKAKKNKPVSPQRASSAPKEGKVIQVKATAYTAYCKGCIGITKTGVDLRSNPNQKVIAVDPAVIPLGSKVYVDGYGYATAADIGGGINGHEVDLYMQHVSDANQWGVRMVDVRILN